MFSNVKDVVVLKQTLNAMPNEALVAIIVAEWEKNRNSTKRVRRGKGTGRMGRPFGWRKTISNALAVSARSLYNGGMGRKKIMRALHIGARTLDRALAMTA